ECSEKISDTALTCPHCGAARLAKVTVFGGANLQGLIWTTKVQVYLNDESVGWVSVGGSLVVYAGPGKHTLKVKREEEWWCVESTTFTASKGEEKEFEVGIAWHGGLSITRPKSGRA